ncbi:MAG: TonB-dependent receptor, partial [Planctomycetales bacterium]
MPIRHRFSAVASVCLILAHAASAQESSRFIQPTVKPTGTPSAERRQASHQVPANREPASSPREAIPGDGQTEAFLEYDLEQLGQVVIAASLAVEVTTVSRTESTVGKSPAAIFVVSNEMIRRSGARSVPEVLRMVPGVTVQRITSNKWAVSIRGFNGHRANKLLVQIDGRDVYTSTFAGTQWDIQDVLLEDVDRIEVIRGPGATVWGANAMNGVINIITKHSRETQGVFAETGVGDKWQSFASARYGGQVGRDLTYRAWGKWFEREASPTAGGFPGPASDAWRMAHGGGQVDWEPTCCDHLMFQGAYYDGFSGEFSSFPTFPPIGGRTTVDGSHHLKGSHVLARWTHKIDDEREWSVQTYYDRTERDAVFPALVLGNDRDTIDVDFQYQFPMGPCHQVVCGFGYRYTDDLIRNTPATSFIPNERPLDRFGYFVQDTMTLIEDRWFFTLGSKFSHNDYTQFEMQPTARLLWTPNNRTSVWGAVSRAVRTPSRSNTDVIFPLFPPFVTFFGNPRIESEEVLAYEFGARAQPVEEFFWDAALYYNDYTDLHVAAPVPGGVIARNSSAHEFTWGGELVSTYELNSCSRARVGYSFFRGDR